STDTITGTRIVTNGTRDRPGRWRTSAIRSSDSRTRTTGRGNAPLIRTCSADSRRRGGMKDAQKPDHVSLMTLVGRLREGRYVIPDFQREFEWKPWDIRELMRSIFLDYYIGSLLLWKGKADNFAALSCEPVYGYQGTGKPEYIVLDGQQRLTAIFYAFLAPDKPLPNRSNRFFY